MTDVSQIRKDYSQATLTESDLPVEPMDLFAKWFEDALASGNPEPHGMTLSTADQAGQPSARTVLLKGYGDGGFRFYTNYQSEKGRALLENPLAAILFWWPELERQVRIQGRTKKVSAEVSDAYFATRPRKSRLGAWASNQSQVISDREELESLFQEATLRFENEEVVRPEHWGGYCLVPHRMEFWQGRSSRLHDRMVYEREGSGWSISRLAP